MEFKFILDGQEFDITGINVELNIEENDEDNVSLFTFDKDDRFAYILDDKILIVNEKHARKAIYNYGDHFERVDVQLDRMRSFANKVMSWD